MPWYLLLENFVPMMMYQIYPSHHTVPLCKYIYLYHVSFYI